MELLRNEFKMAAFMAGADFVSGPAVFLHPGRVSEPVLVEKRASRILLGTYSRRQGAMYKRN